MRLFAYVPPSHLGSNLGPHSMQEGETPRTQQSSVLDSGAPATDKESARDQIEMRQTVAQSHINEREKGTVRGGGGGGGGGEEEKVGRGGGEGGERRGEGGERRGIRWGEEGEKVGRGGGEGGERRGIRWGEEGEKVGRGGGEGGERRGRRWYLIDTHHHMTHFAGGQR